jgi:hypothetical protein
MINIFCSVCSTFVWTLRLFLDLMLTFWRNILFVIPWRQRWESRRSLPKQTRCSQKLSISFSSLKFVMFLCKGTYNNLLHNVPGTQARQCCAIYYSLIPLPERRNAFSRAKMLKWYGHLDIFSFPKKKSKIILTNFW